MTPRSVNLLPKENGHAHHTEEYECSDLVLRRGQEFDMAITFDRRYDGNQDSVLLQFVVGKCFYSRKLSSTAVNTSIGQCCHTVLFNRLQTISVRVFQQDTTSGRTCNIFLEIYIMVKKDNGSRFL